MSTPAARAATVDGATMRWEERGDGMPVVLIHGIPTGPALWRHVMPRLTGARCLAWEMVGYGASIPEGRGRDISVGRQAHYLVSWLRELRIDRVILAGHDLGGGVAQIVAVQHPELCRGLFLTNSIGYDSWPILSVKVMRMAGPAVRHLPDAAFKHVFRTFIHRGHDNAARADESVQAHWHHYADHGGAAAFVRQIASLDVRDTRTIAPELPKLRLPARVVWGAADQFQTIEYGLRLARDLSAPLHRIEGGKHFTPEDHPDIIAAQIAGLVAEIAVP